MLAGVLSIWLIWRGRARIFGGGDVGLSFKELVFERIPLLQLRLDFIFTGESSTTDHSLEFWRISTS